jgi:hypothetical protein
MNTMNAKAEKKVRFVKLVVKAYFITALGISFSHFIHAFNKLGLYGFSAATMPIAIDGLAVVGMVLQSDDFSVKTNKIGRWMQLICGTLSLSVNIFSGWGSPGAVIQGVTWVTIYMALEVIVTKIQPRSADHAAANAEAAAQAAAALAAANAWKANCSHPTQCASEAQCSTKKAARAKAQKTINAKARNRKAQEKALQSLLDTPVVDDARVTVLRTA